MGRLFPAAALLALGLSAAGGSPSAQDVPARKPEVEDLGKATAGDVWSSGPRGGTYADATEISGRTEVARFLVQPAASRGLRGVCEVRREAEDFAFSVAKARVAEAEKQGTSPAEVVLSHHELGQVYSYQGKMSEAVRHLEIAYRTATENASRSPSLAQALRYLETFTSSTCSGSIPTTSSCAGCSTSPT